MIYGGGGLIQGVRFSTPTLKRKELKMEKTKENLTKAWKEGKLKSGFYYVRYTYNDTGMEYAGKWYGKDGHLKRVGFDDDDEIEEVLELVPSYDEYKKMQHLKDLLGNQDKEVEKLRDLLGECKNIVAHDCWERAQFPDGPVIESEDLLTRINTAIGESEE